jgi:hypothetical protein
VLVLIMVSLRAVPVVVEVKLLVAWVLGVAGSFAVGWGLTRSPALRRVL